MFGRKRKEIKSLRAELEVCQVNYDLRCQGEKNAIEELTEVKRELEKCKNKLKKYEEEERVIYAIPADSEDDTNYKILIKKGKSYKQLWEQLYNFMNDHALAIAPDELTDPARRIEMQAQYELLQDLLKMMYDMIHKELQ